MSSSTMEPNKDVFHMLPILISFLCIGGISAGTLCPDNWTAFRGSCYLSPRYNLSFHDAERFCEHLGGYLVEVDDATENTFLKSFLSDLKDTVHWIGLTDEVTEGVWRWYFNNKVATVTNWHRLTYEPNGGIAQNCVYIAEGNGYEWADAPCNSKRTPLCEKRVDQFSLNIHNECWDEC